MANIYPSLLACPESKLESMIKQLEQIAPGFHIDIIDESFAPNKGISPEKTNLIATITYRPLWVHLMVKNPVELLKQKLRLPPETVISFHFESEEKVFETIECIVEKKMMPSLVINPEMGVNEIFKYVHHLYQVTIMTVKPGFSGQPLLKEALDKIEPLVGYRNTTGNKFKIAIDGGVNEKNIEAIAQKGVDDIVVGAAIFDAPNPMRALQLLAKLAEF